MESTEDMLNIQDTDSLNGDDSMSSTSKIEHWLSNHPDIMEYVENLRKIISKQEKKIKKLQRKLKKKETRDVDVQTEVSSEEKPATTKQIIEAAESAMAKTGFVYEETSGLYYDYNSGYYYNAEYGLYYDGNSGTYLTYDTEKQEYRYHSQVQQPQLAQNVHTNNKRSKSHGKSQDPKKRKLTATVLVHDEDNNDLEEGECSDCSESTSDDGSDKNIDVSKHWPPCIRIVIEETNIPSVKSGSLHMITYNGGTLGREGSHDILLPDINVSKHHLKFTFDKELDKYFVTDLGSRNGTLLNGKRMSSSKQESERMEMLHGTRIQIGGTTLLCHVHSGNQTCGLCEPGLIQSHFIEAKPVIFNSKLNLHKEELKKLKKKFAIGLVDRDVLKMGPGYTDRAQVRRETVGSHNDHEKTQAASLDQSIKSDNKGFKLLAKMGWTEGQSLGKEGTGRVEPVELVSNVGTTGIGCNTSSGVVDISKNDMIKSENWNKARQRYQQLTYE